MTTSHPIFELVPVNLHDLEQNDELRQQRLKCGWDFSQQSLDKWRRMMDDKLKYLFWISLPEATRAGHISLDRHDGADPPDLETANPDGSLMTICLFWIAPEFRARGLGRAVVARIEGMATTPPYGSENCKAIVLHAISHRYTSEQSGVYYEVGQQLNDWYKHVGIVQPKFSNDEWYRRQGYTAVAEEPRFPHKMPNGDMVKLLATRLRKELH